MALYRHFLLSNIKSCKGVCLLWLVGTKTHTHSNTKGVPLFGLWPSIKCYEHELNTTLRTPMEPVGCTMAVGWSPVGGSEWTWSFLASACHDFPLNFTSGMSANPKVFFPVKGYYYWKRGCIGLGMTLDGWNMSGWRNVWTWARSFHICCLKRFRCTKVYFLCCSVWIFSY